MASCLLPEDVIMYCIMTRLPVKSILRCKSVCKPWLKFLSSPEFIQLHHAQFSSVPKNQSFIVQRTNWSWSDFRLLNPTSLFSIKSSDKNPTILNHPLDHYYLDIVGCCNGLVCFIPRRFTPAIFVLWNPALKLFKNVFLNPSGANETLSLGFGYDAEADDYKVVSIVCMKYPGNVERLMRLEVSMKVIRVEVYSVNSDSWTIIDPGFRFNAFRVKNDVRVNGNPYWLARFDEDEVLVCFDVSKSVFKILPISTLDLKAKVNVKLVDWNGRVGALCCTGEKEGVIKSLDAWVFDDVEETWRKEHTIKPVEASVDMFLHFTKNGGILGVRRDGELFLLNPESGCVEGFFYGARKGESFEIYECTESLVYIEGMRRVSRKMIDSAS